MYRETLMNQWKNLYSDFAGEYDILKNHGNATAAFNRWYEARVHRWSSITYSEGILLEQENNSSFSKELQSVLKNFRFTDVPPMKEGPLWLGIAVGVAAGVIAGRVLMLLHWGKMKAIISGIALLIVIIAAFAKSNADKRNQEQKRIKEEYVQQLKDYQNQILIVCDKYQK